MVADSMTSITVDDVFQQLREKEFRLGETKLSVVIDSPG